MAVNDYGLLEPADQLTGLSTDSKPTAETPPGTIFKETDSGQRYQFDGAQWAKISTTELQLQLLWAMHRNLARLLDAETSEVADDDN